MFAESEDPQQIIERVAAVDIGKAEVVSVLQILVDRVGGSEVSGVAGRIPAVCSILPMPEDELDDPAASTQMFQAFVDRREEPEASESRWIWVALGVAALLIFLVLAWVVLGG